MVNFNTSLSQRSCIFPDQTFRERYDHRNTFFRITDLVISIILELAYQLKTIVLRKVLPDSLYHQPDQQITWKDKSEGLVVLIHGANGHPSIWNAHLKELDKHENLDRFIPLVPEAGRNELENCAPQLLGPILDYASKHPGPVSLLGTSNGSRIATWLETELRARSLNTAVKVATIGGVHFGTPIMQKFEKWGITDWIVSRPLFNELSYGSKKSHEILDRVESPLPEGCGKRDYEFWASTEDIAVPDLGSSLPVLNKGEKHYVIKMFGHNTMVAPIAKKMIENVVQWTKANQPAPQSLEGRATSNPPSILNKFFAGLYDLGLTLSTAA